MASTSRHYFRPPAAKRGSSGAVEVSGRRSAVRWWGHPGDPPTDGERRGAEQADDEVQQVQQEAERDGLLDGMPRAEEQREQPFPHAEPRDPDRSTWAISTAGTKASRRRADPPAVGRSRAFAAISADPMRISWYARPVWPGCGPGGGGLVGQLADAEPDGCR